MIEEIINCLLSSHIITPRLIGLDYLNASFICATN